MGCKLSEGEASSRTCEWRGDWRDWQPDREIVEDSRDWGPLYGGEVPSVKQKLFRSTGTENRGGRVAKDVRDARSVEVACHVSREFSEIADPGECTRRQRQRI